jgi:hypothetical protein
MLLKDRALDRACCSYAHANCRAPVPSSAPVVGTCVVVGDDTGIVVTVSPCSFTLKLERVDVVLLLIRYYTI